MKPEMKNPHGMYGVWHCAEKRGYSGADLQQRAPDNVQIGMGIEEFDREGRFVRADFGGLSVIFALPAQRHQRVPERQEFEIPLSRCVLPHAQNEMKAEGRDIVVCGDWNIAHQNIDLKNWKGNREKFRLSARRARLDRQSDRRIGLDRYAAHC